MHYKNKKSYYIVIFFKGILYNDGTMVEIIISHLHDKFISKRLASYTVGRIQQPLICFTSDYF